MSCDESDGPDPNGWKPKMGRKGRWNREIRRLRELVTALAAKADPHLPKVCGDYPRCGYIGCDQAKAFRQEWDALVASASPCMSAASNAQKGKER